MYVIAIFLLTTLLKYVLGSSDLTYKLESKAHYGYCPTIIVQNPTP